jgi:selenide,water dikinase
MGNEPRDVLMAVAEPIRLTSLSHGAGCACKLGPSQLGDVLELLGPSVPSDRVIVSEASGDDAAVYRLPDGSGLVLTLDFFTPLVDDPYDWGRIAAANALSDVYAMGGTPTLALNVAGWPVDVLPLEMLADVLRGGRAVADEAGIPVAGGHTITTEKEPLYGMVAAGLVDLDAMIRNTQARPGMTLVLTKPIGSGMITTAAKRGVATDEQLRAAVETMTSLNDEASRAAVSAGVTAGTDVTGFGLLGHLRKMLEASGRAATIDASAVPVLDGVLDLAQRDVVAGGTKRNHAWLNPTTDWGDCTVPEQIVLADAQTSGGLLLATPDPAALLAELERSGIAAARIGVLTNGVPGTISVVQRLLRE